jgi:HlyD family secretion protein
VAAVRRRSGRRRARLVVVAVVLAAAAVAYVRYGPAPSASTPQLRFATVEVGPIQSTIAATGSVRPLAAILVGSEASGQIKELPADFNTPVKRGDVMARLNDDLIQARLAQALVEVEVATTAAEVQRAQVERARAEAASAEAAVSAAKGETDFAAAAVKSAQRDFERKRELVERNAGSLADRDRAEAAWEGARAQLAAATARHMAADSALATSRAAIHVASAQLDNALAQVKQREAVVRQIRIELEHTVIRAPIDGIVIDRNVEIGQTVAASLQAPTLFTIAPDLRRMEVHANIDEGDIGRVAAGQPVSFTVDSFPLHPFHGRVVAVRPMPQTTQNVVSYTVVFSADNDEKLLLPGMTASASIVVEAREHALLLPNAALRYRPPGAAPAAQADADGTRTAEIWVAGASGAPEPRTVRLGITDGTVTEVLGGELSAGEQVVVGEDAQAAARLAAR